MKIQHKPIQLDEYAIFAITLNLMLCGIIASNNKKYRKNIGWYSRIVR